MDNNLEDVDMSDAGELLENFPVAAPGEYEGYMESSERKSTKDGNGELLLTIWRIIGPGLEGVQIWHRFNLWNKNPQAVSIAKGEWNAVCEATVQQPASAVKDSAWVHTKRCIITVGTEEYNGKTKNTLVFRKGSIRPLDGKGPVQTHTNPNNAAQAGAAGPAAGQAAAPSGANKAAASSPPPGASKAPPWANKK